MVEIRTRILGIAPYDGMRTAMENAAQAYPNVLLDVQTGDLDEGQAIVQNIPPNTYDCIISRGGTADLIRRVTDLPVVDIQISVYDVLRAIKLAENYTDLYAIVGFPSVTESAHTLCSLLNYDLDILTVNSAEDVKHTLERLRQGGYRMVVCDMVTHTIARQMGFDAFLIISGVESLHAAIDQAVSISSWFERLRPTEACFTAVPSTPLRNCSIFYAVICGKSRSVVQSNCTIPNGIICTALQHSSCK